MRRLTGPITAIFLAIVLAGNAAASSIVVRITSLPGVYPGHYETAVVVTHARAP